MMQQLTFNAVVESRFKDASYYYWLLASETLRAVWKSKFYGAFVLTRRVVLHAIDATPARGVAMPFPHRSTEPARPRHRREMT